MTTLVMTSWISFLIPPESVPGRSGLLVTLLLVLTTFHLHELDISPVISTVTPLLIWSEICLAFVFLAFLEYSFILFYSRFRNNGQNKDKGRSGINAVHINKRIEPKAFGNDDENTKTTRQVETERRTKRISMNSNDALPATLTASTLDYFALKIFPLCFMLVLVIYFVHFSC